MPETNILEMQDVARTVSGSANEPISTLVIGDETQRALSSERTRLLGVADYNRKGGWEVFAERYEEKAERIDTALNGVFRDMQHAGETFITETNDTPILLVDPKTVLEHMQGDYSRLAASEIARMQRLGYDTETVGFMAAGEIGFRQHLKDKLNAIEAHSAYREFGDQVTAVEAGRALLPARYPSIIEMRQELIDRNALLNEPVIASELAVMRQNFLAGSDKDKYKDIYDYMEDEGRKAKTQRVNFSHMDRLREARDLAKSVTEI